MSAVIVTPSQSEHSQMFLGVAKKVKAKCYNGKAKIYQTVVAINGDVSFLSNGTAAEDSKSFMAAVDEATTFLILSHSGEVDGPRLTGDLDGKWEQMNHYQPWNCDNDTFKLNQGGRTFWTAIGRKKKKIILGGCKSGKHYATAVSEVAGASSTYGFTDKVAAADSATMIAHVNRIERSGRTPGAVVVPRP